MKTVFLFFIYFIFFLVSNVSYGNSDFDNAEVENFYRTASVVNIVGDNNKNVKSMILDSNIKICKLRIDEKNKRIRFDYNEIRNLSYWANTRFWINVDVNLALFVWNDAQRIWYGGVIGSICVGERSFDYTKNENYNKIMQGFEGAKTKVMVVLISKDYTRRSNSIYNFESDLLK